MSNRSQLMISFVLIFIISSSVLSAQEKQTDDTWIQRIQAVSRKAKSVETATEYSQVIAECDSILVHDLLKPGHKKYLKKLLAWALDKRALTRLELSAQFRKVSNLDQANLIQDQAMEDFQRSIDNDSSRWQTSLHRGEVLTLQNRFSEAVQDYTRVISIQPDLAKAWFNRGELRFQLGEFRKGIDDYNKVLELNPKDVQSISGRAHCLLSLNEFDAALSDYDRVVIRLPKDGWALVNRADAHLAMNQWQKARNDLEESIELQSNGEFCRRLAWLLATCPDESICDGKQSLAMATRAIELSGETIENLDTLAASHAAAGEFDRARDVHARVISMQDTQDPSASVKQAAYQNNERYQETFDQ